MLPCSLFILRLAANRNPALSLGPSPWPSIFRTEGITSFLRALRLYDHRLISLEITLILNQNATITQPMEPWGQG
ncbi:hypothetical protein BGW80DRAFT_1270534 [Lactifluus volemus]|nr:hypothetical protein BGW80DRAFT_1270534 [Lactifluus volemus]